MWARNVNFSCLTQMESGRPSTDTREMAGYFDVGPVDMAENVRRDIVLNLEEMGFAVEASHHVARLRPSMRLIWNTWTD